jgi:tRNA threonylcarbamoyl adenosine modification protein YeaZ
MKILAIEFSSDRRSVAVAAAGDVLGRAEETAPLQTRPFHLIEQALAQARIEREEIECLAVGLGPGSYTGIRAAISLAQGWQLALGVRLLGLSSIDCLAAQAHAAGLRGAVNIVVDAQRNEFYLGRYLVEPGARAIAPLGIVPRVELERRQKAGEILIGPEVGRWFAGAITLWPDAAMLARLATDRTEFTPGEKLEPIYLRETSFVKAPPPRGG